MSQLNTTTQQNASSSEELSATAEEMSDQAENLRAMMAQFKVSDQGGAVNLRVVKPAKAHKPVKLAKIAHGAAVKQAVFESDDFSDKDFEPF